MGQAQRRKQLGAYPEQTSKPYAYTVRRGGRQVGRVAAMQLMAALMSSNLSSSRFGAPVNHFPAGTRTGRISSDTLNVEEVEREAE